MATMVGVFTCIIIFVLDVTAGILGIRAEAVQNEQKRLKYGLLECNEPSQEAYRLALAAAVLLGAAHVFVNLLGGYNVFTSRSQQENENGNKVAPPTRTLSIASLLSAWIILAAGLSTLLIGIISNHKSRTSCGFTFTHLHFLFVGGILCFVHGISCVAYYVYATAAQ